MSEDNHDLHPEGHPLPVPGDLPLKEPGFCLNAPKQWNDRAWGFKRAADILTSHVLATVAAGDLLIYPIAFLYRLQLELCLKDIIVTANDLLDQPVKLNYIHTLNDLWRDCRRAVESAGFSVDIPETKHFESCIDQLDRLDPCATAFRYPDTQPNLQSIDLQNLKTVMDRLNCFLDITREQLVQAAGGA